MSKKSKRASRNNIGRKSIKKRFFIIVALLLVIVSVLWAFDNDLTVTRYVVSTEKVDQSVRIVLLADLHSCAYGIKQSQLIQMIDDEKPDIILMSGDIADDEIPIQGTRDLLAHITKKYPCYYVTGNHEFWSKEADAIKAVFRSYGVAVLEGNSEVVQIDGQFMNICGVDDPEIGTQAFTRQLDDAFADINTEFFTILLSHRPERFDQYTAYPCDLVLSGHAHGGQWRIPHLLSGLLAPDQGLFPKYTSGIYMQGDTSMLVSRGLSRESTRIPRIFNPPEIVTVDIVLKGD